MFIDFENFVLDFSGKKIRCNGRVLNKYDVAYHIDMISHECATVYMDVFTYSELRYRLFDKLLSNGFKCYE